MKAFPISLNMPTRADCELVVPPLVLGVRRALKSRDASSGRAEACPQFFSARFNEPKYEKPPGEHASPVLRKPRPGQ